MELVDTINQTPSPDNPQQTSLPGVEQVLPHNHDGVNSPPVSERNLIPDDRVFSSLPASAAEGAKIIVNNPNYNVYQTYQYLGGAWRLVNATPPVLSSLPASADEGTIVVINANNLYTYYQYLAGAWRPLSTTPTISATAGEDLLRDDAVFVSNYSGDNTVLNTGAAGGEGTWGQSGNIRAAQTFTFTTSSQLVSKITVRLKKVGSPVDTITITLRDGEDGNILQTIGTIDGSTLSTSYANYEFTLTDIIFAKNTGYTIQMVRSGSADAVNYYRWDSGSYAGSAARVYDSNSSGWISALVADYSVVFKMTTVAGMVYKCRTDISGFFEVFTGFSTANVSKGVTATIDVGPIHTFANALSGYIQYLTDSPGLISSTPGTHAKEVGVALSSTVLQVSPMFLRNYSSGTNSINSSTTTTIAHGLGVRPRLVRITSYGGAAGVLSVGVYNGITTSTVYYQLSGSSGPATDSSKIIYIQNSSGNNITATIAVDSTNITLTSTLTGTASATFMWEAFS